MFHVKHLLLFYHSISNKIFTPFIFIITIHMSEHKHLTFFSSLTNFIPFGAQSKNFPYLPLKLLFTMFHVEHSS